MLKYWGRDKYLNGILSKSGFMCPANTHTICNDYSEERGVFRKCSDPKLCHLSFFSGSLITVGQLPLSSLVSCADTDSVPDNWIIGMGSYFTHRTFLGARVTLGRNNDTGAKPAMKNTGDCWLLGQKNASASGLRVSLFVAVQ